VELIVALVLGVVVFGVVARALVAQRRGERIIAASSAGASVVDETLGIVAAAMSRVSSADTIEIRGDTAIDFGLVIGAGVACAAGGDSVVVQAGGISSWWEASPDSGDVVDAMTDGAWWRAEISSVQTRSATSGTCAGTHHVLRTHPPPPASTEPPLVRVTTRTRFMIYRGGEGAWWFGERACSVTPPFSCTAAQPIAGPLAGAGSLRFAIDTVDAASILTVTAFSGRASRSLIVPLRP
jgi:hypothetical protein